MPHLVLEYSDNLQISENFSLLFDKLQRLIAEKLPTQLASCKGRCIAHPLFFIGDQNPNNAFVHLTLKILAGRSDELKNQLGKEILDLLSNFFTANNELLAIKSSVEILDLDKHYFKMG